LNLILDAAAANDLPDSPAPFASCADEATLFEAIAGNIEQYGYVHLPAVLPEDLADTLVSYIAKLEQGRFRLAATGRGRDKGRNRFIRRDRIHWLEESHPDLAAWFGWTQRLKTYLNRRLFLGLFSFESHLAHYSKGDFYRKHVDAFKGESNRVLSMVTYLNRGWEVGHGGELVIYSPEDDSELVRVLPGFGTLVLFLSEEFSHEVLPTQRDRYTVAGWFRLNNSINDNIDPPR
jgi:SM-20-related protein